MGALPQSVGACRAGGRLGLSPSRPSLDSLTGAGGVGVGRPVLPVNIGGLALAAAFLVGTLVAGQSTDDIIGFVAITIGLVLTLISPQLQQRAVGQVTWPEILLITGSAPTSACCRRWAPSMANAPQSVDRDRFFRQLVAYGVLVTVLAPDRALVGVRGRPGLGRS